jgi:hypothetical protein
MRFTLMTKLLAAAGSLLLCSCGGGSGLTVKTSDGKAKEVAVKSGAFLNVPDSTSSGQVTRHLVCVANYEMTLPPGARASNLEARVEKADQVKVCFKLNGPVGFDEGAPIKAATYPVASFSGPYQPDKVGTTGTTIHLFENGAERKEYFNSAHMKGQVEITSASADAVSGEINLTDGKSEIKGGFRAEKVKKS